jgi:hypothetical protein
MSSRRASGRPPVPGGPRGVQPNIQPSPARRPDASQEGATTDEQAGSAQDGGESRYRRAAPPAPARTPPPKVRIELVLVGGAEGKQLRARQAAAIREALRWFAQHPPANPPTADIT